MNLEYKLNLEQVIFDKGKDKTVLITELGITARTLQRWLSGERKPDLSSLILLSKVLNCSIDDLIIVDADISSNFRREDVLSYRDLRGLGLNDRFSHGLIRQINDGKSIEDIPFLDYDDKVKLVYKDEVVDFLGDLIKKIYD